MSKTIPGSLVRPLIDEAEAKRIYDLRKSGMQYKDIVLMTGRCKRACIEVCAGRHPKSPINPANIRKRKVRAKAKRRSK